MSELLPNHFTISFSSNVELKLQQMGSMLRGTVTEGSYTGKSASPVNQYSAIEMQEVTSRFAPMGRVDSVPDRRWVSPKDFDLPQLIDTFDKLKTIVDPESTFVQNAVFAAGRKIDRVILAATTAAAATGEQGAGSTSFNSSNTVTVSVGETNSRLNVPKLLQLKEKMRANFVDFDRDEIYIPLTAKDESNMFAQIQIVSKDFAEKPVLMEGKLHSFLGFRFVYCELTETVMSAGGGTRIDIPCWAKSGMHLGMWNGIQSDIDRRKDLQGLPWQAYVYLSCGATRIEENKVYVVQSFRP